MSSAPSAQPSPRSGVLRSFSSLVFSQVVAAVLGYAYWVAAARSLTSAEIAAAYSSVAAMMLLGNLAQLGYGTLLLAELPSRTPARQRALIANALLNVGGAGVLLGTAWVLIAPHAGPTFHLALATPTAAVVFVVGVAGTAVGLVLDQAVLGLGRAGVQVIRNLVASSLKFPLALVLIALGRRNHTSLLIAWVAPLIVAAAVIPYLLKLPRSNGSRQPMGEHLRQHGRAALLHHTLNLALQASPLLLPLLAARSLSTSQYANFSLAWLVATFVFIPPFMLAVALFAASVGDLEAFSRQARRTLPGGMLVSLVCYVGAAALALPVMVTFGSHYAHGGPTVLRVIALGGFAFVVKDHYFALYRVRGQLGRAAVIALIGIVLELAGAGIGAALGKIEGLSAGWLVGLYVQAIAMLPVVLKQIRHTATPTAESMAG